MTHQKRMWLLAGAVLLAAAAVIVVCTVGRDPGGTVTSKEYEPATAASQSCTGSGARRKCQKTAAKAECWEVEYRRADGSEVEVCVPQEQWAAVRVGGWFRP